jgi:hypothetical protein
MKPAGCPWFFQKSWNKQTSAELVNSGFKVGFPLLTLSESE